MPKKPNLVILSRLQRQVKLTQSFFEPFSDYENIEQALTTLELVRLDFSNRSRAELVEGIYDYLFRLYPIIRTKIDPCIFESWVINHDVQELRQLLKLKEGSKRNA